MTKKFNKTSKSLAQTDIDKNTLPLPTTDSTDLSSEEKNNEEWQIARRGKTKRNKISSKQSAKV